MSTVEPTWRAPAPEETFGGEVAGSPPAVGPVEAEIVAELAELRKTVRNLRRQTRSNRVVSRAVGMLQERYRLADDRVAFTMLARTSQNHNLPVRTLASAFVAAPRPRHPRERWFAGRGRWAAPPVSKLLPGRPPGRLNRTDLVRALLRQVMEISGAPMGNVQLVDVASGGLELAAHHGLTDEFVDFFQHVGEDTTSCALAAQQTTRVSVSDVATTSALDDDSRIHVLAAGSRSCHSTPLLDAAGRCVGVVSSHHERPASTLTDVQTAELDRVTAQAGRWLQWHDRTTVLDALEDLHALALGR
ncbi:ANTAR domain-containing protein [Actinoallomurus iriomotensis]|uniref:Transcription antitermination regulator n=1 Tax=Actinoallomurus iriomotensis TaxID=478107 RepID=A0A9W6VQP9_9ACTN|nr:ANTAR domain-containing protein [Actinoallomurus iriomotensis]GLY75682.1 transcription antitermination regulator [Actinoallomurus iriomotensis]